MAPATTWTSSYLVMTLSLVASLSRPSRCVGDARDIMQGELSAGDKGRGPLTLFLGPGRFRPSPHMFLIKSPMPLAHDGPANASRSRKLCSKVWQGDNVTPFPPRPMGRESHRPRSLFRRRPRGPRLHSSLPRHPQSLRWRWKGLRLCLLHTLTGLRTQPPLMPPPKALD